MDDGPARGERGPTGTGAPGRPSPRAVEPGLGKAPAVCPFCGSDQTELISLFGSTSLTSQYHCRHCRSAFERVKR